MYPVCNQLINYIENKTYNLGIYPGSFNPFHIGHLNIVHQAEKIFDKVIVAKGCNIPKTNKEFHLNGFNLLHYEVDEYSNLLTQYLEKFKNMNCKFSLIRGLRNSFDVNYENNFKKAIYLFIKFTLFLLFY
jgi:phosphopantetheine adenylyltransferase